MLFSTSPKTYSLRQLCPPCSYVRWKSRDAPCYGPSVWEYGTYRQLVALEHLVDLLYTARFELPAKKEMNKLCPRHRRSISSALAQTSSLALEPERGRCLLSGSRRGTRQFQEPRCCSSRRFAPHAEQSINVRTRSLRWVVAELWGGCLLMSTPWAVSLRVSGVEQRHSRENLVTVARMLCTGISCKAKMLSFFWARTLVFDVSSSLSRLQNWEMITMIQAGTLRSTKQASKNQWHFTHTASRRGKDASIPHLMSRPSCGLRKPLTLLETNFSTRRDHVASH